MTGARRDGVRASGIDRKLLRTITCRYGRVTVPVFDTTIGKSLEFYGEWGQQELDLMLALLPPGGVAVDVGAYLGTHTLAFSRRVGARGSVLACEPRPTIFDLLRENVLQNSLQNVELLQCAIGQGRDRLRFPRVDLAACRNFGAAAAVVSSDGIDSPAERIEMRALDDLALERLDLLKVDVEGMEAEVLRGAQRTLRGLRPSLYLECSTLERGRELLELLRRSSYRVFCHRPAAFNPNNFRASRRRIFGREREAALLAIAGERTRLLEDLPVGSVLAPIESGEQLAAQILERVHPETDPVGRRQTGAGFGIDAVNGQPFESLAVDAAGRSKIALEDVGLLVTGWVMGEEETAGGVVIRFGRNALEPEFGFARPDLAERYQDPRFLRSGFALSVPRWMVAAGELCLDFVVLSADRVRTTEIGSVALWLA